MHSMHPLVGTCEHCGQILHYLCAETCTFREIICMLVSLNTKEGDAEGLETIMAPLIADRVRVTRDGLTLFAGTDDESRGNAIIDDALQDMKRLTADHFFRRGSISGCTLACTGPNDETACANNFYELMGQFTAPGQDEKKFLVRAAQEKILAGASKTEASRAGRGFSGEYNARHQLGGIRHISARITRFEVLHAGLSVSHLILRGLSLEVLRGQDDMDFVHQRQSTWNAQQRKLFKATMRDTRSMIATHFRLHLPLIMVTGGATTLFTTPEKRDQILDLFIKAPPADHAARRQLVGEVLEQYTRVMQIIKSHRPADIINIHTVKQNVTVPFGKKVGQVWPEFNCTPYLHLVADHTQEMLKQYTSGGLISAEGAEAQNHWSKVTVESQARGNAADAAVDVLWNLMQMNEPVVSEMLTGRFRFAKLRV
jgi:hypothetical protein